MRHAFFVMLVALPTAVFADFEMRYDDGTVGLVADGRVMFGDDQDRFLIEAGKEEMLLIDDREKTVMRVKPGFMKDMMAQARAEMEQMLAGMPPEQRAMVEAQMGNMLPPMPEDLPALEIVRTGNEHEVAGYDCDEVEVRTEAGAVEEVLCVADADELGIDDDDFETLTAAMRQMMEMASVGASNVPQADFGELGGVPIRTSGSGNPSALVSIDTGAIDAARMQVPAGYREVTMEEMMRR